jgi:hypothetical protein
MTDNNFLTDVVLLDDVDNRDVLVNLNVEFFFIASSREDLPVEVKKIFC